ncbi:hypothetical protein AB0L40_07320 [Patulibacter sp. NPDC049589]|uniref:hypothetical protein n=1 Tax=Patulibacter sp. NPDC049589 TaxID=3154731 RepID=UPI00342EAE3B
MIGRVWIAGLAVVVGLGVVGCGGGDDAPDRPGSTAPRDVRLDVGDGRTAVPDGWKLAPEDTGKNVRDVIAGTKESFDDQRIRGARFVVRDPTRLGGTRAVVFDTYVPAAAGGQVLVRTLVGSRGSRMYSLQVNGPASDGPRMRGVVEGVRRAWTWR